MSTEQTISVTVQVPVTNLTAEAIENAVIAQALAAVLGTKGIGYDEDGEPFARYDDTTIKKMRAMVEAQLSTRVEKMVADLGPTLVSDVLNAEFQPMTAWGEHSGPPTTIRHMVYNYARSWLDGDVQENGAEIRGYYGGAKVKRLHFTIRAEVDKFFKTEADAVVKQITAEVKPAIAARLTAAVAESVNRILGVGR